MSQLILQYLFRPSSSVGNFGFLSQLLNRFRGGGAIDSPFCQQGTCCKTLQCIPSLAFLVHVLVRVMLINQTAKLCNFFIWLHAAFLVNQSFSAVCWSLIPVITIDCKLESKSLNSVSKANYQLSFQFHQNCAGWSISILFLGLESCCLSSRKIRNTNIFSGFALN